MQLHQWLAACQPCFSVARYLSPAENDLVLRRTALSSYILEGDHTLQETTPLRKSESLRVAETMASFGKISNSLIQGTNENTFALANINFDFSLVSLAAPAEFTAVGTALAPSRRENAEHGALHRTARKLGALFESVVPQVPRLVSAYGKRASEIMKLPTLNPSGNTDKHGPFAAFVGADATSIWAAATSGGPSIAIHLLGCLLARSFSDPTKSISALVELVHERQSQIRKDGNTFASTATHMADLMAAEQLIARDELQQWDTSARAWLQTADSAMQKEHIQLKLILQNISLPVTSASTLYDGVIRAWTQAMCGLERLLNGESQSVTDGAILLAISAWHLYPNLLVLGREPTNVDFGDRGIHTSGILTVGITGAQGPKEGAKEGIYWSMALSHYRHYGRALNAVGEIDDRLTIDQLHFVALGSLLRDWNVSRKDVEPAAKWLVALEDYLNHTESPGCPPWLAILTKAAREVSAVDNPRKKEALALVEFGQRRGTNLLHPRGEPCLPWFGLRFSHIVGVLAAGSLEDCSIEYLRSIARAGELRHDEALITCITNTGLNEEATLHQYFTAITPKDRRVGTEIADIQMPDLENEYGPIAPPGKGKARSSSDAMSHSQEPSVDPHLSSHQTWGGVFSYQVNDPNWSVRPRDPFSLDSGQVMPMGSTGNVSSLKGLPASLQYQKRQYNTAGALMFDCDALLPNGLGWFRTNPVRFDKFIGHPEGSIRLWLAQGRAVDECDKITRKIESLQSGATAELLDIETAIRLLNERSGLDPLIVSRYIDIGDPYEPLDRMTKPLLSLMRAEREHFEVTVSSLRLLQVATKIYNGLDGATISSSFVERGLYDAEWAPTGRKSYMSLAKVFSCIAMMETGKISLDAQHLEQVIALSSGNSLFVPTRLLTDPYDYVAESSVTRIVGNIGRPGLNLLIPSAVSPLTRSLSTSFRAVTYAPFNGRLEDNFKGTTLHLSFTSHKFPLDYGVTGIVDHQVFFVESVISIHDSGQWVADLDIDEAFGIRDWNRMCISRRPQQSQCTHPEGMSSSVLDGITSIDTWEELLDINPGVNIIRAHKNWPARLAALVMLAGTRIKPRDGEEMDSDDPVVAQSEEEWKYEGYSILENGDKVCWVCLHRRLSKTGQLSDESPFYIIA